MTTFLDVFDLFNKDSLKFHQIINIADDEPCSQIEVIKYGYKLLGLKMPKKILTGVVISDKPNKTITVMVERKYSHPVLKKVIRVRKNYNAHDENNTFKTGDKVSIIESKPFSKNKKFQVMENNK